MYFSFIYLYWPKCQKLGHYLVRTVLCDNGDQSSDFRHHQNSNVGLRSKPKDEMMKEGHVDRSGGLVFLLGKKEGMSKSDYSYRHRY
jgi:hypothetical protein